jgi:hypothetical protein
MLLHSNSNSTLHLSNTLPRSNNLVLRNNNNPRPRQSQGRETNPGKTAKAEPGLPTTRTHDFPWVFVRLVAANPAWRHIGVDSSTLVTKKFTCAA